MLISPNHDHAAALVLEELQTLLNEMKAFCLTYGPQREDMEEDDDAAILMLDIALLLPPNLEGCLEAIRLTRYFLDEHCWQEDAALEEERLLLLERAYRVLPREKRPRRVMRQWLQDLESKAIRLF
ncbi:hypothetical protein ACTL32_11530 [Planococcus sp. FY231025]|uniref:hypothetical protein n=1 Tax=Planococcus sp. FY231025 TaxID=3455699 RepID=UPI003F92A2A1